MTVHASQDEGRVEGSAPPEGVPGPRSRRPMLAGALGAAWALLVGVALVAVVVMLAWAVSPNAAGDSAAAWRAVGAVWLGAHLVPLSLSGQTISLLPIGGLLLGLMLTRRSGRWAARMLPGPGAAEVIWIVLGAAATYGAGGAGVAWVSGGGSVSGDPRWTAAITAAVAAAGTLWGLARQADLVPVWRQHTRQAVWSTAMAGIAAVLGLLGAGAALVSVGLLTGFSEVAGALADLDPGPVGAAGVTLLGALSLPTLDVWAMALVVGPGFDLGGLGGLSAFGGEVGSLPALPVLAAIPAAPPAWAPALLVIPVVLGVLAGRIRWGRDLPTPVGALLSGLGVAAVVAGLIGGLVALASGSLGDDRLAHVGPLLLPVMGSAAGLVVLGFWLEAGYQSLRLTWDLHRAESRAVPAESDRGPDAGSAEVAGSGVEEPTTQGPGVVDERSDGAPGSAQAPQRGGAIGRRAASAAGRVMGAGGSVTSGIAGAGASAVSVVAGAGSAVTSLVSGTLARRGADEDTAGAAGPGDAEAAAGESAHDLPEAGTAESDEPEQEAEHVGGSTAESGEPLTVEGDLAAGEESDPVVGDPAPDAGDEAEESAEVLDLRADEAIGVAIDLRGEGAEPADLADTTIPAGEQASSSDLTVEPGSTEEHAGADAQPEPEHEPAAVEPSPEPADEDPQDLSAAAPDRVPGPAEDRAPVATGGGRWAGTDDDTDEIPITRRVPATDVAQG